MLNKIKILGSSSSGCCYILNFDKHIIQFDAGIKNPSPEEVDCVLISHETHTDHDKYLKDFKPEQIIVQSKTNGETHQRKDYSIKSFYVPHKTLNNGYVVNVEDESIGYVTDCGDYNEINEDFSSLTYLFVEVNWDYFLITQKIIPSLPHSQYSFSKLGHMSNLECLNALAKWNVSKDCKLIFIHKSSFHASYDTTYKMFDSLENKKYIAKKGDILYTKSWKVI